MKTLLLLLALILLTFGCGTTPPTEMREKPAVSKKKSTIHENISLFELTSAHKIQLQFLNLDNGSRLVVQIEEGISQKTIPVGSWELRGFENAGESFFSMNTSKKFVLTVKPKNNVYGGSLVIACPAIRPDDFKHLKTMKFFNRYPFRSSKRLCELVVGNDLTRVKSMLKKSHHSRKLNLIMGF